MKAINDPSGENDRIGFTAFIGGQAVYVLAVEIGYPQIAGIDEGDMRFADCRLGSSRVSLMSTPCARAENCNPSTSEVANKAQMKRCRIAKLEVRIFFLRK